MEIYAKVPVTCFASDKDFKLLNMMTKNYWTHRHKVGAEE